MPIQFGAECEAAILQAAGIDPTTIDTGSLDITLINPDGHSTVRCTLVLSVDTAAIREAILNALPN
jgi:hypothetical protein